MTRARSHRLMRSYRYEAQWAGRTANDIEIQAATPNAAIREALRVLTMHEREAAAIRYDGFPRTRARQLVELRLTHIDGENWRAVKFKADGLP